MSNPILIITGVDQLRDADTTRTITLEWRQDGERVAFDAMPVDLAVGKGLERMLADGPARSIPIRPGDVVETRAPTPRDSETTVADTIRAMVNDLLNAPGTVWSEERSPGICSDWRLTITGELPRRYFTEAGSEPIRVEMCLSGRVPPFMETRGPESQRS